MDSIAKPRKKVRQETQEKYGNSVLQSSEAEPRDEDPAAQSLAVAGQECDPNSGSAGSVGPGGSCCIGGVVECNSDTNGSCSGGINRFGTYGVCGIKPSCGDGIASAHECSAPNVCPRDYAKCEEQGFTQTAQERTEEYHRERFDELTQECLFDEEEWSAGSLDADCVQQLSRTTQTLTNSGVDQEELVQRRQTLGAYYTATYNVAQAEVLCANESEYCQAVRANADASLAQAQSKYEALNFDEDLDRKVTQSRKAYAQKTSETTRQRVEAASVGNIEDTMSAITQKCAVYEGAVEQERCLRVKMRVQLGLDIEDDGLITVDTESSFYKQFCTAADPKDPTQRVQLRQLEAAAHCTPRRTLQASDVLAESNVRIEAPAGICNFPGGCECQYHDMSVGRGELCYQEGTEWVTSRRQAQLLPDCGGEGQLACGSIPSNFCDETGFEVDTSLRCVVPAEEDADQQGQDGCPDGQRRNTITQECVPIPETIPSLGVPPCPANNQVAPGRCRCLQSGEVIEQGALCQLPREEDPATQVIPEERADVQDSVFLDSVDSIVEAGESCPANTQSCSLGNRTVCVTRNDLATPDCGLVVAAVERAEERDALFGGAGDATPVSTAEAISRLTETANEPTRTTSSENTSNYFDLNNTAVLGYGAPLKIGDDNLREAADYSFTCGGPEQVVCIANTNYGDIRVCDSNTVYQQSSGLCLLPEVIAGGEERVSETREYCQTVQKDESGCILENGQPNGRRCEEIISGSGVYSQVQDQQCKQAQRTPLFVQNLQQVQQNITNTVESIVRGVFNFAQVQNAQEIEDLSREASYLIDMLRHGADADTLEDLRQTQADLQRRCDWANDQSQVAQYCSEFAPRLEEIIGESESDETTRQELMMSEGGGQYLYGAFEEDAGQVRCGSLSTPENIQRALYCCPSTTHYELHDSGRYTCVDNAEQGAQEEPAATEAPFIGYRCAQVVGSVGAADTRLVCQECGGSNQPICDAENGRYTVRSTPPTAADVPQGETYDEFDRPSGQPELRAPLDSTTSETTAVYETIPADADIATYASQSVIYRCGTQSGFSGEQNMCAPFCGGSSGIVCPVTNIDSDLPVDTASFYVSQEQAEQLSGAGYAVSSQPVSGWSYGQ
ncbi:hypothetical protein LRY60_05220 [Candidatus Woesebacteria bacterium]|nr:hypothetical protein [Candidatus Woesebacteria bacterium]